jgi:plastocyanin
MLTNHCSFGNVIIPIFTIFIILCIAFGIQYPLFATTSGSVAPGEEHPNINASTMFETHSMILGDNIKNLVILIPNEAHESTNQPKNQYPFINQPYLPQNAVVNVGTAVTWFNGDVDHDHKITLFGNSNTAELESGDFAFNVVSKPVAFNEMGTFNYFEADVNNDDPNFVMNGTINVINQVNSLSSTSATALPAASGAVSPDTVGTYMVPAKDLNQYISTLTSKGFNIDSTHTFEDLRGGQKGTGPEQTLIVWTASGMNIDQVISALEEITPSLPYS